MSDTPWPDIDEIIRIVAAANRFSPRDVHSTWRNARLVRVRHTAMWLARRLTDYSYPTLGCAFGWRSDSSSAMHPRDHTSVMHAVRRIDDAMRTDKAFAAAVLALAEAIEGAGGVEPQCGRHGSLAVRGSSGRPAVASAIE